ncbi:MAG TPA: methyl-accepting chemotaxis protein, partial [Spirochaeta sp.]|nr:methyl-accepting chemotaxis protein [Spirochaeta sp.]
AFSEINSSSLEMSAGSDQVLNAMFSLSELSIKLSSAAEKMKEGTHKVSTNIASVLELSQTANAAIEEISFGSNEILSAMINMQDNVQNLGDSTGSLSEEVDSFKTD